MQDTYFINKDMMAPSVFSLVYLLNYLWLCLRYVSHASVNNRLETEFKEFEPHLELGLRLKYGWFNLKLY